MIYFPKYISEVLINKSDLVEIIKHLCIFLFLLLIIKLLSEYINKILSMNKELFKEDALFKFSVKINQIEYYHLENPQILDLKESAVYAVSVFDALNTFFTALNNTFINILICLSVSIILLSFSTFYFLFVFSISIVSLLLSKRSLIEGQKTTRELIPLNRRYGYYDSLSMDSKAQKDIRVNNATVMLITKLKDYNKNISNWLHNLYAKQSNIKSIQIILGLFLKAIAYIYLSKAIINLNNNIKLGEFILYIGATESFNNSFIQLISNILKVKQSSNYLEPFSQFMNLEENEARYGKRIVENFTSIEFQNVYFTYPGTNREILKGISFRINRGEKFSLVGLNGSGKSTIIKLICRFFIQTKGTILLNGHPIEEYDSDSYNNLISVIFQDFAIFSYSVKDNINLTCQKITKEDIENILGKVGLNNHIDNLSNGINTYLNKSVYENSTEFSGGQNQRLVIARALLKDSDFIILDEPTAQLDPLAEGEIIKLFSNLIESKTAIFISHRMSTCTISDKVIVLEDGIITAMDSHTTLIKNHDFYKRLFHSQSEYYTNYSTS